jgi:hypothetical protein
MKGCNNYHEHTTTKSRECLPVEQEKVSVIDKSHFRAIMRLAWKQVSRIWLKSRPEY